MCYANNGVSLICQLKNPPSNFFRGASCFHLWMKWTPLQFLAKYMFVVYIDNVTQRLMNSWYACDAWCVLRSCRMPLAPGRSEPRRSTGNNRHNRRLRRLNPVQYKLSQQYIYAHLNTPIKSSITRLEKHLGRLHNNSCFKYKKWAKWLWRRQERPRDIKSHSGARKKHSRGARQGRKFWILLFKMAHSGVLYILSNSGAPKTSRGPGKTFLFFSSWRA